MYGEIRSGIIMNKISNKSQFVSDIHLSPISNSNNFIHDSSNIESSDNDFQHHKDENHIQSNSCIYKYSDDSDLNENRNSFNDNESKELYKLLVENQNDLVVKVDTSGKFMYVSPSYCDLFGMKEIDLIGKKFLPLVHENDKQKTEDSWNACFEPPFKCTIEQRAFTKRGWRWIEWLDKAVMDKNGNITAIICVGRDIHDKKLVELELLNYDKKVLSLINHLRVTFWEVDEKNMLSLVRGKTDLIFGKGLNELINANIFDILPNYDFQIKNKKTKLFDVINNLDVNEFVEGHVLINNNIIEIRLSASVNEKGEICGHSAIATDVTEKKRAEIKIAESEEKYRLLFDTMIQGVVYQDKTGKIISANSAAQKILGYTLEELIGASSADSNWDAITENQTEFPGQEHPAIVALQTGKEVKDVLMGVYNPKEKIIRWINVNAVPQFNKGENNPYGVFTTFDDISDKIEAIQAQKLSEARYYRLFNEMLNGFTIQQLIKNEDGEIVDYKFLSVNPSFCKMTGLAKDIEGKTIKEIDSGLDLNWIQFYPNITEKTRTLDIERYFEGLKKWFHITGYKVGEERFATIFEDITDRKIAEKTLQNYSLHLEKMVDERTTSLTKTNAKLEVEIRRQKEVEEKVQVALHKEKELSELKSNFISLATHEFKTPLTTIRIFSDLIKMDAADFANDEVKEYIQNIHSAVDYMLELIDDVLVISRNDTGRSAFNPVRTNLHALCQVIFKNTVLNCTAMHQFDFSYKLDKDIYSIDEKLMKQIVTNLLSNSIKYSPKGGKVEFNVYREDSNMILSIKDEGLGVNEKDKKNIFEPFFRSKSAARISGTGLGLSIVKRSVDLHGGTITLESELNKGSKFTVSIPIPE